MNTTLYINIDSQNKELGPDARRQFISPDLLAAFIINTSKGTEIAQY